MNLLTFTQSFSFGVKRFKAFRKHLMTDPKKLGRHQHTNPHAIPFKQKQQLLKSKKGGDWKKIREIERQSLTPYGRFAKHGFIFQRDRLPVYDIPNIEGFELSPYVEYLAPKVKVELLGHQKKVNEDKILEMKQPQIGKGRAEQNRTLTSQ